MPKGDGKVGLRLTTAMVANALDPTTPPELLVSLEIIDDGEIICKYRVPGVSVRVLHQALEKVIADYPDHTGTPVDPRLVETFKVPGSVDKARNN